jgi:hypothetical protein
MNRRIATTIAALLLPLAGAAHADAVSCGDASLGVRVITVDPALVGGFCHAQIGNLRNADITALGLNRIERDVRDGDTTDDTSGRLMFTFDVPAHTGTWSIDPTMWDEYIDVYLGFHFGNATGQGSLGDPDSFVIELARGDTAGTWALEGTNAALRNLSNIQLIAGERCATNPAACVNQVSAPGSLPLALLAAGAAGFALRRRG